MSRYRLLARYAHPDRNVQPDARQVFATYQNNNDNNNDTNYKNLEMQISNVKNTFCKSMTFKFSTSFYFVLNQFSDWASVDKCSFRRYPQQVKRMKRDLQTNLLTSFPTSVFIFTSLIQNYKKLQQK